MSDDGILTKITIFLLFSISVLIFLIFIYIYCRNRRSRSGYEHIESESALSPTETRLAKSSFYVRSAPSLPPSAACKYKPEDQEVIMSTPVDFAVFTKLHEGFKQQVTSSTQKYYEIKESATKLIDF